MHVWSYSRHFIALNRGGVLEANLLILLYSKAKKEDGEKRSDRSRDGAITLD